MKSLKDIVRAKNVDLLIHSYNLEADRLNNDGFIDKESPEVKRLKNKYESIMARFDTDKNTIKKSGEYGYKIELDSQKIVGLKGVQKNIKINSGDGNGK